MLSWHIITRAAFDAGVTAGTLQDDALYFLSDTKEIYKKDVPFTEGVYLYDGTEPTSKAVGKIYINSTTLEGKVWNGTAWKTVIQPVAATLTATDTAQPVSGKAVADYVKTQIENATGAGDIVASLTFDKATSELKVGMSDASEQKIALEGLAVDLVYNKTTGLLQVKDCKGTTIGTGISLDLERFVQTATYDAATKKIILGFNPEDAEDVLEIDVGDLVDTYTAKSSETITLTVTGNEFTAEAIVSAAAGNQLQKTAQGLYVAAVDTSAFAHKVDMAPEDADPIAAGTVATLTATGDLAAGTAKIGAATLEATPSVGVLATEKAVAAVRDALQTAIDGKMNKVAAGHADEILVADADGQAALSGVKVGGEALAVTPDAATLATEKAVAAYVTANALAKSNVSTAMPASSAAASDEKVLSEKAVAGVMEWKTTV
ncbi:hypothetical protein [uncultured Duncaniella sp.]|uniref:hypothetical protein n=1 Tax=uncultured Duncaniella sp. TaxID=2768039 RepID=UPI002622346E|nr:hypothetical protein [uncultured Duncaniella sp.]